PFSYIWVIFCALRKLVQLRDIYTSWYPEFLYVHSMNKLDFLGDDAKVFKEFFGKEYRNIVRFFLICLSDLVKDFPVPHASNVKGPGNGNGSEGHILIKFK